MKGGLFMKHTPCRPEPRECERLLLQRIVGSGRLQYFRRSCTLPFDAQEGCAKPPFTLTHVQQNGPVSWQQCPGIAQHAAFIRAKVPILLTGTDACCKAVKISACLEETFPLQFFCQPQKPWKLEIWADVRLCCPCTCACAECCPLLDVCIEAYALSPHIFAAPCTQPCADPRPWYPQTSCCR